MEAQAQAPTSKFVLSPGFTIRHPEDELTGYFCKSQGITSYYLRGEEGAVQVLRQGDRGVDRGYHSSRPIRSWQEQELPNYCNLLASRECYYDGSTGGGEAYVRVWLDAGRDDEVMKELLMEYYTSVFFPPSWEGEGEGEGS